jgi:hypothetical protein
VSDVRQNKSGKRGALSGLSSEWLLELIRDAFLEDGDSGYLDMLTEEYMSRPDALAIDIDAAWRDFQDIMSGVDFKHNVVVSKNHAQTEYVICPRQTERRRAHGNRRALRVYLVAAAVIVLLFALATVAGAFPAVSNAIARWTDIIFTFDRGHDSADTGKSAMPALDSGYEDLRSALEANGITAPLALRWIPDGYELDSVNIVESVLWTDYTCAYTDVDGASIMINIVYYSGGATDTSASFYKKDDGEVITYDAYGVTHYIMTNNSRLKAVWKYDSYECSISVPIGTPMESLTKMIDSIY